MFDAAIPNANVYMGEMSKPLVDKLFMADKVLADVWIDYGCADGVVLQAMKTLFPNHIYIGYDISEPMLEQARAKRDPSILFTSDWQEIVDLVSGYSKQGRKNCLILESMIHEAESYLSTSEKALFWSRVWGDDRFSFDAIAIRDMMVSTNTSRPSDPIAVARVNQIYDARRLAEWQEQWGSITENWSLTHFLLTYRYVENWERELRENYLPIPVEKFMRSIPARYMPIYHEHFVLPFIRRQVHQDFKIVLSDPTHLKLILERAEDW